MLIFARYYTLLFALGHLLAGCAEKAEESMPGEGLTA